MKTTEVTVNAVLTIEILPTEVAHNFINKFNTEFDSWYATLVEADPRFGTYEHISINAEEESFERRVLMYCEQDIDAIREFIANSVPCKVTNFINS